MKKVIVWLLVLALTVAVSIGATLAYLTDTENGFDYTPGDTYVDWEQIGKDGYTSEIWDPSKINNEQYKRGAPFVSKSYTFAKFTKTLISFW